VWRSTLSHKHVSPYHCRDKVSDIHVVKDSPTDSGQLFCRSMKDSDLTDYQSNSAKADQMCPFTGKSWGRFPRRGSSTSLHSFVSCTGWRLQSGLHSNNQSSCTSVYTGPTCIPYWRALSGGRCRGSSPISFQFIFIIDCQPHLTPYCRWPSFPGRRYTCLEQSARSCHFRTFCSSLPVSA